MSKSPVVRITGNSIEQYVRAQIAINYHAQEAVQKNSSVRVIQFQLSDSFTPSMTNLLGFKGLNYHLRQANGKYYFTVSLGE